MKALILGCGRQGALLAKILEEEKVQVTVIDNNPEAFNRLENFHGKKILGDGISQNTLHKAGIRNADAFVAVTNSDNVNLMAAQIAKGLYQVSRVVCRIYDPRRASIYSDLGLETVNYSQAGAHILKSSIMVSGLIKKYQLGDGSAVAVEVKLNVDSAGKKVSELEIPGEFRVASVVRGLKVIIPGPDMEVKEEDHVFGVVKIERLTDLMARLSLKGDGESGHKRGEA
jgi:trk system potassium uptake protein TrkA